MQDSLVSIISTINAYMFDYILTFMLVMVGLWFSFQTKFVQVRCFFEGIGIILKNMSFSGSKQSIGITPFRALIFLGMATMYAETVCALGTRKIESDFMIQSNSIASTLNESFGMPNWITGFLLTMICGFVLKSGVERISFVTEKIVPMMSYLFIGGAIAVLVARIQYLPDTLYMIFYYAFEPQAILGGGFGEALKIAVGQGVKRGLFSNEAGMGSIPHAHVQANVDNPHSQGIIAMNGVFF